MKAAVFHGPNQPLAIEDVNVDKPRPDEVLLNTGASGVCHSDLHYVDGLYPKDPPAILGHEGAGIVEAVGDSVTYVQPGDHVITCPSVYCGNCRKCLRGQFHLCLDKPARSPQDTPRYKLAESGDSPEQMAALGTFAEQMLVHQNSVAKIPDDVPMDRAALIGCGVTTGVGAVLNTAKLPPGATVAVYGAGGVGLSAIQGARIAGASQIIAVDPVGGKLERAEQMGATHTVDASKEDPVEAIKELTGGGVEYSFEAVGNKQAAEQCYECLQKGGTATIIGMIPFGQKVTINGTSFLTEKKMQGSTMGSNRFRIDMLDYIDYYRQGKLMLDEMITRRGRLEDVNEAFRAMKAGEVARTVLMFD